MSVDSILTRQAGVISRPQALTAGLTPARIDQLLRVRRWRPLHPQVYLAAGHRADPEVALRAAALWAGEGAVVSGVAAAWWLGMTERPAPTVYVAAARGRPNRPGVAVRRHAPDPRDVVEHRGLLVAARPLAALQAAVQSGPAGGELLDRALRRWVRFPAVHAAHVRTLGSPGSAAAGRLLRAAADRSAPEAFSLLVRLLSDSGLRGWTCGLPFGGTSTDVAFPRARLVVEVAGWAWHLDTGPAQADAQRHDALVRAGWRTLRYTWHDLVERPRVVLAEIAHALRRSGVTGPVGPVHEGGVTQ